MLRNIGFALLALTLVLSPLHAQQVDEQDLELMRELGVKLLFEGREYSLDEFLRLHPNTLPTIPMDLNDPLYDAWKLIRDNLSEGREPGPINIQHTS